MSLSPPFNYSLHAIPIAWSLCLPPHLYTLVKSGSMTSNNAAYTNITPRINIDDGELKAKVDSNTWSKLLRARGCHLNALEGFPLFAAAMIAGNYAGLSTRDMNTGAAEYLAARMVYSVLYMTVKSEAASYLRTGVWMWSVGIPVWVLWKAGNKFNEGR